MTDYKLIIARNLDRLMKQKIRPNGKAFTAQYLEEIINQIDADIGMTHGYISSVTAPLKNPDKELRNISIDKIQALAKGLGVDAYELMDDTYGAGTREDLQCLDFDIFIDCVKRARSALCDFGVDDEDLLIKIAIVDYNGIITNSDNTEAKIRSLVGTYFKEK